MREFTADISVLYAFNQPDLLVYLSNRELSQIGLTGDQLHALAVSNISKHIEEVVFKQLDDGLYGVACGGVLEASLLLLDGFWERLTSELPGIPLAVVPARDLLFVTGSKVPGSMQKIAKCARIPLADKALALSQIILARTNGQWAKSMF
ncbi:nitrous oxide reductase accessory protein NosL [Niveibacterium sp. 24ML]|nr:nitrous oxide reductase accessory protein NosL [Niveibacterium sp. 24ML]